MEMILTGRMMGGEEAHELGLVDQVFARDDLIPESERFVNTLVGQHNGELVRTVLQSLNNGCQMNEEDALKAETELFCSLAKRRRQNK